MRRMGVARIGMIAALIAAGLVFQIAPASAVASSGSKAVAISAGGADSCAVLADGTAECWGNNSSGQLGNGTVIDSSTPVVVRRLTNAVAISAGGLHSCALLANGTAKCWGNNTWGQLGNGIMIPGGVSSTPVVVRGL
jgi:alpha-tubulin suppressor-like RCC1 family protein